MEMVERYLNEQYFTYLLIIVGAYFIVWGVTFLLSRPFLGLIKAGNPYVKICNCWIVTMLTHTLVVVAFSIATCMMMVGNAREPLAIFIYNIGFVICFLVNTFVLTRLVRKKAGIVF